jgi:hypothetical protein
VTPEQKLILDDVEARLATKCLVAVTGQYGYLADEYGHYEDAPTEGDKLHCRACALGSLFLGLTASQMQSLEEWANSTDDDHMREELSKHFSKRTVVLIESAFEQDATSWGSGLYDSLAEYEEDIPWKMRRDAARFGDQYEEAEDRLKAIIKNIRANNGEFVPPPVNDEWDTDSNQDEDEEE